LSLIDESKLISDLEIERFVKLRDCVVEKEKGSRVLTGNTRPSDPYSAVWL